MHKTKLRMVTFHHSYDYQGNVCFLDDSCQVEQTNNYYSHG